MPFSPNRSIPQRELTGGLQTIPNVAADLSTVDTWIYQIVLANKTGGAVTVTILDKAASPKTLLGAVSIAANTTYVVAFPDGVKMTDGVNWVASAANSIDAEVFGTYRG